MGTFQDQQRVQKFLNIPRKALVIDETKFL